MPAAPACRPVQSINRLLAWPVDFLLIQRNDTTHAGHRTAMPEIQAFHGLRYDLGHVGSLSDVVCPPYDVIGPDLQTQLYKKHPANFIRLELNRDEPGD